ncbi:hypothetical protein Q8A73_014818 [Channa argus]|nr:hypothetical protein Q8A73_014818 [Channa argus]
MSTCGMPELWPPADRKVFISISVNCDSNSAVLPHIWRGAVQVLKTEATSAVPKGDARRLLCYLSSVAKGENRMLRLPNNAGSDSSSDVNVSRYAQHHIIQFAERNSLIGGQTRIKTDSLTLAAFQ